MFRLSLLIFNHLNRLFFIVGLFTSVIDEINERSEFLTQMRKLGRLKEYQTTVETEISQVS